MQRVVLIDNRLNGLEPIFVSELNAIPGINIATPKLIHEILAPFFSVALKRFRTLDGTIDGVVVTLGSIGEITILALNQDQYLVQPLEPKLAVLENRLPYSRLKEVMSDLIEPLKHFFVDPEKRFVTVRAYSLELARDLALPLFQKNLGYAHNPVQMLSIINKQVSGDDTYKYIACYVDNIMVSSEIALLYLGAQRDENPRIGFTYRGQEL